MTVPVAPPTRVLRHTAWLSYLREISEALLIQAQCERGMPFHRDSKVPGMVTDPIGLLPAGAEIRLDQRLGASRTIVAEWPGLLAEVQVDKQVTFFSVVGAALPDVEGLLDQLSSAARLATTVPDDSVRMRFWSFQRNAGDMSTRQVEAPAWVDVAPNYAERTRAGVGGLMATSDLSFRPGRLILWHGAPGTGKTTAVRALSREWSSWCRPHYVIDPERLFAEPQYLLQVAGVDGEDDDEGDDEGDHWRLVIAEDCDEYLRSDAKLRAGASLGRLLNLCDGILGHGLKVLVLLTTNEDVGRLHPAITRPGRCLSRVEFQPLTPAEARAWLGTGEVAPERPVTLAELFALKDRRAFSPSDGADVGGYL